MEIVSLSRLCLESVADNMAVWCQSALKEDFYKYLYAIGPFNDLNSTLIQELLDISNDKQLLKASYFPLLFHENFTKLDLSRCHSMITDQILKLVCLRCKYLEGTGASPIAPLTDIALGLTHLNLNGCSRLSNSCLNETLPTLQSLRSLQLSNCRGCTDQLLHNLAKHCRNLQELVVNLCPKVTDVGIEALFTKDNPGCFDIIHLNVSATSVTTKSLAIILVRLPKLRKLCFSDLPGANNLGLVGLPFLNIEHLDIFATFLVDSDLKVLVEHCPKLAVLRLNLSSNLSKMVANHLTSLSHLKSLDLGGASEEEILFEDVEKFLKKRGGQLESLNLFGMHNVRISVLCIYCKSLKELILAHCQNVDPMLPSLDDLTKEQRDSPAHGSRLSDFCPQLSCIDLNFTTFRDNGQPELYPIWISCILSDHANLKNLSLKNADINDEVLAEQVCGSSSSLALRILDLTNCNAITVESVRGIVEKCRNLRLLDLSHCKQIDLGYVSKIKKSLKETRNPLQIVWV